MGASSSFGPGSSSISRRHRTIVGWLATNHTSRSTSSAPITTRADGHHAAAAQEPPVYGVRAGHGCLLRPLPDRHAYHRPVSFGRSEADARRAGCGAGAEYLLLVPLGLRGCGPRNPSAHRPAQAAGRAWPVPPRPESHVPGRVARRRGVGPVVPVRRGVSVWRCRRIALPLVRRPGRRALAATAVRCCVRVVLSYGPAVGASVGSPTSGLTDRKSTRLNSSHSQISYAVFCLKKKRK